MKPFAGFLFLFYGVFKACAGESTPPLMRDFMGINGHTIQFKPDLYSAGYCVVRDYHPVDWDLQSDTSRLPEWPEARNRVNWEQVYGSWRKQGYTIDACLMFESVPRNRWKDVAADSRAYGRSFARGFGPSGTRHLLESVEIGNEPGKWNDADFRLMFENMAQGIREGDPKLLIATCNLTTEKSSDYSKSVTCLQGLEKLYDVLTIHSYAQLENWPTWRRSFPEDPKLPHYLRDIQALCEWRDLHASRKPVWITEFGYDSTTQPQEKQGDFKQWVGCTDEQQAQWIVRSYLIFSAMPVQRAYLYFFNDEDQARLHSSSGITRHFKPKPSFYAVSHLYQALGGYRYSRTVANQPDVVRVQEYSSDVAPRKLVWVIWSPTGDGHETSYTFRQAPGRLVCAQRMPLTADEMGKDVSASITASNGALVVPVTGSPLYLFWAASK